jgi:hypothetical protein
MFSLNYVDIIGWIATALTLLSFMTTKMSILRLINFLGCVFWVAFGVINKSNPIIVTNIVIAAIHTIWYYKWKFHKK